MKRLAGLLAVAPALALALSSAPGLAEEGLDQGGDPGVARLSELRGSVDIKRSDSGDAFAAAVNAPVSAGDYITTAEQADAEVEYTFGAALRVAPDTQVRFTRLDPDAHVVQLAQGTVELRVLRGLGAGPEVQTPAATIRPDEDGRYRVTVTSDGNSEITARSGRVDVVTQAGTQTLTPGGTLLVTGSADNAQFQTAGAVAFDDFDGWNDERDAYVEHSQDYGYVDQGIVGADDLDHYGSWSDVAGYGQVWQPSGVDADWSPYQDGRWTWQPYYGWTWVAAEPWGWAPYHYGRWFQADNRWCWYPGVRVGGPVGYGGPLGYGSPVAYQPALVAFFSFGGLGVGLGFGNIGWVPLAPFETLTPWWGRGGYGSRNSTNINITNVTYNNYGSITKIYRNARVRGGALGIDRANFSSGNFEHVRPVAPNALAETPPVRGVVPIVPTARNLAFSGRPPAAPLSTPRLANHFASFAAPRAQVRPFTEQQAAVQELARKAYPNQAAAFERPAEEHLGTALHNAPAPQNAPAAAPAPGTRETLPVERRTPVEDSLRGEPSAPAVHSVPVERPGNAEISRPGAVGATHASSPWERFGGKNGAEGPGNQTGPRSNGEAPAGQRAVTEPRSEAPRYTPASSAKTDPFSRFGETGSERPGSPLHGAGASPERSSSGEPSASESPRNARSYESPAGNAPGGLYGAASRAPRPSYAGGDPVSVPHEPAARASAPYLSAPHSSAPYTAGAREYNPSVSSPHVSSPRVSSPYVSSPRVSAPRDSAPVRSPAAHDASAPSHSERAPHAPASQPAHDDPHTR